ncbi:MMPL family transporter [Paenibacillus xylanexedens]|uniref:RND superfamily putative drug exporter n=1 Tax=Paenibacillus xylanexedens TaxID=528191 RepID=A0ABS4RPZ9_PAEXY|nr:MMPL family transporter [Paenibacillus xylanexedens]MBP2244511.1 RND superfamily putative drug exporter [Paenibacillus xylanexedens]
MGYRSLAAFISRYPRFIILCWVFIIGMSAVWAWKLPDIVQDHGLKRVHGDAQEVDAVLEDEFGSPADPVILVFEKKENTSPLQFRQWIKDRLTQVQVLPAVTSITSPLDASERVTLQDQRAYALVKMDVPAHQMGPPLEQLRAVLATDGPGTVQLTGEAVVQQDVNHLSFRDLERAEMVGLPIALIVLCFAFRGLYAALIAVMMGISAVITAMGVTSLLGYHLELSNFIINVIPMVGMALSIDFALIILSRYREEVQRACKDGGRTNVQGRSLFIQNEVLRSEILQRTLRTAGRAVLFSAACVLLGLLGLLWIRLPMFLSVSLGAIIVLLLSLLLNVTLLPALLSLSADRVFRRKSVHWLPRRSVWYRWSAMVMKRPVRMAIGGTAVLLLCVYPVTRLELSVPDASSLPERMESRQAAEQLQHDLGQKNTSTIEMVIGGQQELLTASHWQMAHNKAHQLMQDSEVLSIVSPWGLLQPNQNDSQSLLQIPPSALTPSIEGKESTRTAWLRSTVSDHSIRLIATVHGEPGSEQVADWLDQMRNSDHAPGSNKVKLRYGGEAAKQYEIMQEVTSQLPKVLVFVVVTNYLVLLAAFRSMLIPIKAILMNLLSLAASFGILVWVFNEGHLGMEPSAIAIMIPVFIAGLVFGISMDYGVFMLSRIQEVYRRTGDSDVAVQQGLASTGRLVTSAAAILLAVTVPFAFAEVAGVRQLGIGITAAVLIDVTLIRLILVPALMKLMGRWNWWLPGQMK